MIHIGMVGCGSIGAYHEACLSRRSDVLLAAFCDADEERARSFAQRHEGSYATADTRRVLRDERIDAVYVCTRNDSHARLGIEAASAGKHILMEKPLALTQQECDALAEAVERAGVLFMSAFKFRYEPAVERARAHVPSPLLSIAQVTDSRWPDDFWGNDPVQGGGNVLSQGCHAADLLCYLHRSEPASVIAAGGNMHHKGLSIVDTVTAAIRFANGSLASLVVADCGRTPLVSKFSVQLLDGSRTAHLSRRLTRVTLDDGDRTIECEEPEEIGLRAENDEFIDALQHGRQPGATLTDGVRATMVMLAAIRSLDSGREEHL